MPQQPSDLTPVTLTEDERRRFNDISGGILKATIGLEAGDSELELPFFTKSRDSNTICRVTGERIPNGADCIILFTVRKRRKVAFIKNREVFELLLEAGTFTTAKLTYRRNKQVAAEEPVAVERDDLPPHMNTAHCIQCGTTLTRPDNMLPKEFVRLRRCVACRTANKPMSLGVQRFCRICGKPFMPAKVGDATCDEHKLT